MELAGKETAITAYPSEDATFHSLFVHDAAAVSVTEEPLLIVSAWQHFISGLPPPVYACITRRHLLKEAQSVVHAITECSAKNFGDGAAASLIKSVPVESRSGGSGRRAVTAFRFCEVHALFWDSLLVRDIDRYIQRNSSHCISVEKNKIRHDSVTATLPATYAVVAPFLVADLVHASDMLEPLSIDEIAEYMSETLVRAVGVPLDEDLLKAHIAPVCQLLDTSLFLARTLCKCNFMAEIIGKSLCLRIRSFIYCNSYDLPEPDTADSAALDLLRELIETRQALTALRTQVAFGHNNHKDYVCDGGDGDHHKPLVVNPASRRTGSTLYSDVKNHKASLKTSTLEWALNANLAFKNTPQSLIDVARLSSLLRGGSDNSTCDYIDKLCANNTLGRHCLALDEALDFFLKEKIDKACTVFSTPRRIIVVSFIVTAHPSCLYSSIFVVSGWYVSHSVPGQ